MKLLEMVRGRGWDRKEEPEEKEQEEEIDDENSPKPRRGRDKVVHFGKWRSKPELGLANIEWVIVDEADVLFGAFF
jgi:ATP-dependent RNA helicase MRH4